MGFRPLSRPSSWRKLAASTWRSPVDPSVYGTLEIDATAAIALVERLRAETEVPITITHLVGRAAAIAIRERPDANGVIRRGQIYLRDTVDVFFQVASGGAEDLSGVKIDRADEKSLVELARELREKAEQVRSDRDPTIGRTKEILRRLPTPVIGAALRAISFLTYDLDLDLSRFGIPYDGFGSVMVTSIGGFGLAHAYAPLVPFARTTVLIAVGAVQEKAVVREGAVVVRKVVTIGVTFDHRFMDGYQAGILAKRFQELLEEPEGLL